MTRKDKAIHISVWLQEPEVLGNSDRRRQQIRVDWLAVINNTSAKPQQYLYNQVSHHTTNSRGIFFS